MGSRERARAGRRGRGTEGERGITGSTQWVKCVLWFVDSRSQSEACSQSAETEPPRGHSQLWKCYYKTLHCALATLFGLVRVGRRTSWGGNQSGNQSIRQSSLPACLPVFHIIMIYEAGAWNFQREPRCILQTLKVWPSIEL